MALIRTAAVTPSGNTELNELHPEFEAAQRRWQPDKERPAARHRTQPPRKLDANAVRLVLRSVGANAVRALTT